MYINSNANVGEQGMCISPRSTLVAMGYSVRVYGWRYTAWVYFNTSHFVADWNATRSNIPPDARSQPKAAETSSSAVSAFHPLALELYDHQAWLDKRKQQFIKGQLSYDKHMGFEPYD